MSWAAVTARGTLARWVLMASAGLVVLLFAVGAVIAWTAADLRGARNRQGEIEAARTDAVSLVLRYVDQETALRGYVITTGPLFLKPYDDAEREIPGLSASLTQHLTDVGLPDTAQRLQVAYGIWREYARQQIGRVRNHDQEAAINAVVEGEGKRRFDTVRDTYRAAASALQQKARDAQADTRSLDKRLLWLVVFAVAGLAVLIVAGTWVLIIAVAWPVARLAVGTRAVASGHLSAELPASGAGEIKSLATDVTAMRDRLTVDIDVAKKALDAAKQHSPAVVALREALQPHAAPVDGLDVVGRIDSAEGVLAGDWYDVVAIGGHAVAIVVGDVSGHGPQSAVLALRFRHAVAAALKAGATPGRALSVLGDDLANIPDDMFATVLVITVDTRAETLTYANAGHPSGLLIGRSIALDRDGYPPRESGANWTRVSESDALRWLDLPVTGPLLSPIVAGWAWGEREIAFRAGDTMLAFTDGLTEARDPLGEQFGVARILDVVADVGVDDGRRLVDAICAAAVRHANLRSRQDDQTIVYARRTEHEVDAERSIPLPLSDAGA